MVHTAVAYARQRNRLATFACTSSVGPGATNMVTGAALATINRLPVLLLPGDTFATRVPHPVLQGLEIPHDATLSVNDTFRPVARFYERVERPEQLIPAALEAMRVLTDPAETGAVVLALPEDVQAEAFEFPEAFVRERVWTIYRQPPASEALARAVELIRAARRPLIVAGGGVIYSEATADLRALVEATGIPVAETQAGRGALVSDHPLSLGAIGSTGTFAANRLAAQADLVIGVGTRWSDFTTASKSAFQDPEVRFINVNVSGFDAAKQGALSLVADARVAIERLTRALQGHRADHEWSRLAGREAADWASAVIAATAPGEQHEVATEPGKPDEGGARPGETRLPTQAQVIGAINDAAGETGVVVCAAGSAPGDLHRLWRARDPAGKGYHVEYGYSCMGYEIAGGVGVKLAAPEREVFVLVGDGSYLLMPGELVTAVVERTPIVVVLVDNHGYASIGALSRSLGASGFGTHYRMSANGNLPLDPTDAPALPVDLATSAEGLGARVIRAGTIEDLRQALSEPRPDGPLVIAIETDRYAPAPDGESWWEVPVAEISDSEPVRNARQEYERARARQRSHL
jgi:3D-(3,5/4)-trihydroxycyclohexane-1,2-dione acylhydrolase (decyclizing)